MKRLLIALLALISVPAFAEVLVNGQPPVPNVFSGTTCDNCAMSNPVFTGTPTVNGAGIVTSVNSVAPVSGNVLIPTTTFVTGFTPASPGTWANLNSTMPCNAARLANYAVVSDLYSGSSATNEVTRCTLSGSNYYWRPQRTDFAATLTTVGGTLNISCGTTAPTVFLSGTLTSNLTINFSNTNCWPGATQNVASNLTLGIFSVTSTGLLGGVTKLIGLNGRATYYYDATGGWQAF